MQPADIIELLVDLKEEEELSRNAREKIEEMIYVLGEEIDLELRVDRVRSILDALEDQPNLPNYVRTQLWHITASLEML